VARVSRGKTTLVVATNNRAKVAELRELCADLPVEVLGLADVLAEPMSIAEDGATFRDNALKKAITAAAAVKMLTLADDSGLEVDALGGRPGVRSARYAGERATDAENNAALLAALADVDVSDRSARFHCVLALVDPFATSGSEPVVTEGACEGSIAREPRGAAGFGYDPLFLVGRSAKTMAELTDDEKNTISHRACAMRLMKAHLRCILESYQRLAESLAD
jgi:XTP/dITP diphosphohydrolase